MKSKILAVVFMFFLSLVCYAENTAFVTKTENLTAIDAVNLACAANLHIRIGDTNTLVIKASESDMRKIKIETENNCLKLLYPHDKKLWWDVLGIMSSSQKIRFDLTIKSLKSLTASSAGKIYLDSNVKSSSFYLGNLGSAMIKTKNITTDVFKSNIMGSGTLYAGTIRSAGKVDINAAGSGHLKIRSVVATAFDTTISGSASLIVNKLNTNKVDSVILGSGTFSVEGKAKRQYVKVDGSGRYYAGLLKTKSTSVKALGSSSVEVYASNFASVDIFGSAIVNIDGQPTMKTCNVFGSGQVILAKDVQ